MEQIEIRLPEDIPTEGAHGEHQRKVLWNEINHPCEITTWGPLNPGEKYPWHKHPEHIERVYVVDGALILYHKDKSGSEQVQQLPKGSCVTIPPNIEHTLEGGTEGGAAIYARFLITKTLVESTVT